jgi:hypothetical protein
MPPSSSLTILFHFTADTFYRLGQLSCHLIKIKKSGLDLLAVIQFKGAATPKESGQPLDESWKKWRRLVCHG